MEQISRMAAEVNKLIGGKLLSNTTIYLPNVGSLYIAEDSSSNKKKVEFSSNQQGVSLIAVIEKRASCTEEQATEIYNRWLEEVKNESTIVIEGVGELRDKSFIINKSFGIKLNPEHKEQTTMKGQGKKGGINIILIAIIAVAILIAGYFIYSKVKASQAEKAQIEAIAKKAAAEQQRVIDSINIAQIEARRIEEAAQKEAAANKGARYKVVYGVYELRSNVDNAHRNIAKIAGSHEAKEYPFGALTLVSMFESDNRQECQAFLMTNYDEYPDSWVYDSQQ